MKVTELARAAGVTPETVRHYARQSLLNPRRDPDNGYQLFDQRDLERLRFIQRARTLGFSLKEIADILEQADQGDSPCPLVRDLLAARLPQIHARIQALQALADRMERAMEEWANLPDGTPDGHSICRLIEQSPATGGECPATARRHP
ncbi:MerR family transcriptional regulator [Salinicola acroporae]|uniref:MerR family transcriptional regulator n=1 Tax=Salinicola acroporae TaxID=1541440 RepID=A0ABT6I992_9GAMM|nr:MerR family transcriptional regulator [Salinicola acroporae]MDH4574292.1 MerR family transcriptional regulator [Salinicola acroporae]